MLAANKISILLKIQGGPSSVLNLNYLYFDLGNVKYHSVSDRYSVKSLKFTKWVAIR